MDTVSRKPYSTDLTNEQWAILGPLIPPAKHGGHPREVGMRGAQHVVRSQPDRLPMGPVAPRSAAQEHRLPVFQAMAGRRHVAADHGWRCWGKSAWRISGSPDAQRWLYRQSNRKNDGTGWRARVRWREEDQRAKTPCFRGYFGALAGGGCDQCSMGRWGRRALSVQPTRQRQVSQTDQNLGGQQVSQSRTGSVAGEAPRPLGPGDQVSAGRSSRFRARAQTMGRR